MSKINIPASWKLVPTELTDDMLVAACRAGFWRVTAQSIKDVRAAYAAMLAAAPAPPVDAVLGEPVAKLVEELIERAHGIQATTGEQSHGD